MKSNSLAILAAALWFLPFFTGTVNGKIYLKPITCYHFEQHGYLSYDVWLKSTCAIGTFTCYHASFNKTVVRFSKEMKAPYYKADCGKCDNVLEGCSVCGFSYCNLGDNAQVSASEDRDLLDDLPLLWSREPSPIEVRRKLVTKQSSDIIEEPPVVTRSEHKVATQNTAMHTASGVSSWFILLLAVCLAGFLQQ